MVRPAATGLATAFYRLFLLEALVSEPARPAALLARIAAERLPLASGGFSRALQALLDGGYLVPAPEGAVALTPLGAAERMAERERWKGVIPTVARILGEDPVPRAAPAIAEAPSVRYRTAEVAEAYLDRVLVAALRERLAQARDGGRAFALALGVVDVDAKSEATRRAMVHCGIRASLGWSTTICGRLSGITVIRPWRGSFEASLSTSWTVIEKTTGSVRTKSPVTTVSFVPGLRGTPIGLPPSTGVSVSVPPPSGRLLPTRNSRRVSIRKL